MQMLSEKFRKIKGILLTGQQREKEERTHWEDGEPGTGRRRCPLKNLTDISRQGHVYREETCGWTPPANSEPDLRNCLQKFTNDISSSACSHVGEKKTQKRKKKKAKTKMHLIMTRTSIKNEPGRLRVKTKIPT